jgi:hypothetical protein
MILRRVSLLLLLGSVLAGCEPAWRVAQEDIPEGLVSVWGTSSSDVWAVGGDVGSGPAVLHWDGARWTRRATGQSGDLWWVNGAPGGPVFFGGENGMILEYEDGTFTRMDTPGTGTVFGIWAASAIDAWAVGGIGANAGFAWHYDGASWTAMSLPDIGERGLFKVWGTSPSDVWLVGAMGAMYHWDGSALEPVDAGTTRTLFTVHAEGDRAIAVGGAGTAALVEREGGVWVDRSPSPVSQLFGVWTTEEESWAVGLYGTIVRRTQAGWAQDDSAEFGTIQALHAVWVDESGGVWAVGGQILTEPLSNGVIVHRGTSAPDGAIEEGS